MQKLLTPLKNKIPQIALIIFLLVVQAYTSLTLPSYTADIVNIGIQNANFDFILNTGTMMILMVAMYHLEFDSCIYHIHDELRHPF